jgi:hypothetical protein
MEKFLQILSLVFLIFGLAECRLSIGGLNKTISSNLQHLPRQYCGAENVVFTAQNPKFGGMYEITSQVRQGQSSAISIPNYPGATYNAWNTGNTAYVEIKSTLAYGLYFWIGTAVTAGVYPQDWSAQIGVLPAIPGQTTTSDVDFVYITTLRYFLGVIEAF